MSMTVDVIEDEIRRLEKNETLSTRQLAEQLHPFIERHIAAGQQGMDADALALADKLQSCLDVDSSDCIRAASMLRRLAAPQPPKPAGAVPLPEPSILSQIGRYGWTREQVESYGDAREAAARGDHVHAGGWQGLLNQILRDTAKELGCEPDNEAILEAIHALKAAGRAAGGVPDRKLTFPHPLESEDKVEKQRIYVKGWNDCIDAMQHPPAEGVFDLLAHLTRQREWSERTFGPGNRTAGVVDHIRKELIEVESSPEDVTEWIDIVILALDGAWRAGHDAATIIAALQAKQAKNESRTWPDWRTADPGKAIEHDRSGEPAPAPQQMTTQGEALAWQAKRSDGSPLAVWEACTREAYEATVRTGRYLGFENGPTGVARELYTHPSPVADADSLAEEVIALGAEREQGYANREHGGVVNGRVADKVVALARRLTGADYA